MDLNNKVTIYYTIGLPNVQELWERKNIVISLVQNNASENTVHSRIKNVDVIGSEDRAFHPAKIVAPPHPEPESEAEQKPDEEKQADGDKSADLSPKAGRRITKVIPDRFGAGV